MIEVLKKQGDIPKDGIYIGDLEPRFLHHNQDIYWGTKYGIDGKELPMLDAIQIIKNLSEIACLFFKSFPKNQINFQEREEIKALFLNKPMDEGLNKNIIPTCDIQSIFK